MATGVLTRFSALYALFVQFLIEYFIKFTIILPRALHLVLFSINCQHDVKMSVRELNQCFVPTEKYVRRLPHSGIYRIKVETLDRNDLFVAGKNCSFSLSFVLILLANRWQKAIENRVFHNLNFLWISVYIINRLQIPIIKMLFFCESLISRFSERISICMNI